MFDRVSVLIPYQSDGNGPRDCALEWVLGYYAKSMPEIELCIGEISGTEEPFSRSKAINRAYTQAFVNANFIFFWFSPFLFF